MVAGVLVVGAAAAVLAVAVRPPLLAPQRLPVCAQLRQLQEAIDLSSVGDQAVIRVRAAALADVLADGSSSRAGAEPIDPTGGDEFASAQIAAVLSDPAATIEDLTESIELIVLRCARDGAQSADG